MLYPLSSLATMPGFVKIYFNAYNAYFNKANINTIEGHGNTTYRVQSKLVAMRLIFEAFCKKMAHIWIGLLTAFSSPHYLKVDIELIIFSSRTGGSVYM